MKTRVRALRELAAAAFVATIVSGCVQPPAEKTTPSAPDPVATAPAKDSGAENPQSPSETPANPPSSDSTSDSPPAPQPAPEAPAAIAAAAKISDLAYKYAFLAHTAPKEFSAAAKAKNGCALAKEFTAAVDSQDFAASTTAYCELLRAQGAAVRDCDEAAANAEQLAFDLGELNKLCASGSGSVPMAKSLVLSGLAIRVALGLELPL